MNRDEARRLLGGYATGSLTEAERTALFQAALEDQELFDELASEQALKEVLDQPGARQRLITALEPQKERAWIWALGGAAAATLAIVIGVVVSQRTPPPPQQIAQVLQQTPEPVTPPAARAPVPSPPRELRKAETENRLADQVQEAKPQAAVGALRQFAAAPPPPSVFAFTYAVSADGYLEITPTVSGFLSVTARDAVVFSSSLVGASTLRFAIPAGATSLVIAFSRTEGIIGTPVRRDVPAGRETDQDPPNGRILIQLSLKPATQ